MYKIIKNQSNNETTIAETKNIEQVRQILLDEASKNGGKFETVNEGYYLVSNKPDVIEEYKTNIVHKNVGWIWKDTVAEINTERVAIYSIVKQELPPPVRVTKLVNTILSDGTITSEFYGKADDIIYSRENVQNTITELLKSVDNSQKNLLEIFNHFLRFLSKTDDATNVTVQTLYTDIFKFAINNGHLNMFELLTNYIKSCYPNLIEQYNDSNYLNTENNLVQETINSTSDPSYHCNYSENQNIEKKSDLDNEIQDLVNNLVNDDSDLPPLLSESESESESESHLDEYNLDIHSLLSKSNNHESQNMKDYILTAIVNEDGSIDYENDEKIKVD